MRLRLGGIWGLSQLGIGEYVGEGSYPDAACKPSPRDPPVTTTTFPFKEKILGKSLRSVSYLDISKVFKLIRLKVESRNEERIISMYELDEGKLQLTLCRGSRCREMEQNKTKAVPTSTDNVAKLKCVLQFMTFSSMIYNLETTGHASMSLVNHLSLYEYKSLLTFNLRLYKLLRLFI